MAFTGEGLEHQFYADKAAEMKALVEQKLKKRGETTEPSRVNFDEVTLRLTDSFISRNKEVKYLLLRLLIEELKKDGIEGNIISQNHGTYMLRLVLNNKI